MVCRRLASLKRTVSKKAFRPLLFTVGCPLSTGVRLRPRAIVLVPRLLPLIKTLQINASLTSLTRCNFYNMNFIGNVMAELVKNNRIHGEKSSQFIKNILHIVDGVQQRAFRHPLWHSNLFFSMKKVLFNSNLSFRFAERIIFKIPRNCIYTWYCINVTRFSLYLGNK